MNPGEAGFGPCYLPRSRSGVAWLLDAESARLREVVRQAEVRTPQTPVDPDDVLADLPALRDLLRERHFGLATRPLPDVDVVLDGWARRLTRTAPRTWGGAVGDVERELSTMLGDNHLRILGAPETTSRAEEMAPLDPGPAVETRLLGDVLVVRVRRLMGDPSDEKALASWVGRAREHFRHDRIVVDLRGNAGGNDGHTWSWAEAHLAREHPGWCRSSGWEVGDRPVGCWNPAAWWSVAAGAEAVPPSLLAARHNPSPSDTLTLGRTEETGLEPGGSPWRGSMLVYVDAATCSSGESSAWLLKHGFGARLVGAPTQGKIEYGDIARYVLPRSGLVVSLPTKRNDFGLPVEHVGFPVDLEVAVDTPVEGLVDLLRV